jgi:hypothetical protein
MIRQGTVKARIAPGERFLGWVAVKHFTVEDLSKLVGNNAVLPELGDGLVGEIEVCDLDARHSLSPAPQLHWRSTIEATPFLNAWRGACVSVSGGPAATPDGCIRVSERSGCR